MSHRRPDPRQATFELTLRRALRLAADSIEPAADGLERIRTKIAAAPPAQPVHRTWLAGWSNRYVNGVLGALSIAARYLEPAVIRIRYAYGAVTERFRPDLRAGGWVAWLRPVAAMATGLLVITGASWAIAALPQYVQSVGDTGTPAGAGSSSSSSSSHHSTGGYPYGGGVASGGQQGSSAPTTSPSCKAGSASGSPSASSTPSTSASSSASGSPSPTSTSPSPTTSSSGTGSASPTDTPTGTPSAGASGQATSGTQSAPDPPVGPTASAAAAPKPQPQISNPRTVQSTNPSPSASGCG
jgi:hypothetical protein